MADAAFGFDINISSEFVEAQTSHDVRDEQAIPRLLRLATSIDRFEHLAVFRRFGDLNILSILCLQAELVSLRSDLMSRIKSRTERWDGPQINDLGIDLAPFLNIDEQSKPDYELLERIRGALAKYSMSTALTQ